MHSSDLTFITNENGDDLQSRFASLIKDTQYFDVLVGYFYTSGFHAVSESLESTDKVRILIGISTNRETYDLLQKIKSHKEVKDEFSEEVKNELENSDNTQVVEEGILKFTNWLKDGKLEIRAYPEEKIHSKLYIMTFPEEDRDAGRVITGSSNFTRNGLIENLEFNVELKNRSDYEFAKAKFEELWLKGVDVSEKYVETIKNDTWLRDDITPYELYLKFLYEYFKEEINQDTELDTKFRPEGFKELQYQDHAVLNAKKIVNEYGGVFLSDVVGLGKTFMGTMLCQELDQKTLVLAPPHLIDEHNTGSWEHAFREFGFRSRDYKCRSIGMLKSIIEKDQHRDFDVVLIDEAHRFRSEGNDTYALLAQICKGKKVILVTATPYNNTPSDLLAQIKLFQRARQSTLPNLTDLEAFFRQLDNNLKGLDRKEDREEFIAANKENARLIRERVLKYLMVRRTRREIIEYYGSDLKAQKMSFPIVADPQPVFYELNEDEDRIFLRTIELVTQSFSYARYTPLLFHKGITAMEEQSQKNMMSFMKMLLVKRLESSFYAFQKTLERFIFSYEKFIEQYDAGSVYLSKKHAHKIFEYLERGDFGGIDRLVDEEKAERYDASEFSEEFREMLDQDQRILTEIHEMWQTVKRDPKVIAFREKLAVEAPVKKGKSIIFTESKETAEYLARELEATFPKKIICFTGESSAADREVVISNFDAKAKNKKDDYNILITTDVLAEGANLHQSNVVINYDIPWNPTRIMQRVGRINRVDTTHKKIHTYTFFPTEQANELIKLQECAEAKIAAFISLLGADAKLLTEGEEIEAHSLFTKIISKETIEGEEEDAESELKYLQAIRAVRDKDPSLFERIKRLPKKSRSARKVSAETVSPALITYFRKGRLQKFFRATKAEDEMISEEIDFIETAQALSCLPTQKRGKLDQFYYQLLEQNAEKLEQVTTEEITEFEGKRGSRDNAARLLKFLKQKQIRRYSGFTDIEQDYLEKVIKELDAGGIPKKVSAKTYKEIESDPQLLLNPIKVIAVLKKNIASDFLQPTHAQTSGSNNAPQEIILSQFLHQ